MRQKIFLEPHDLDALKRGEELHITVGGVTVPLAYLGRAARAPANGNRPEHTRERHSKVYPCPRCGKRLVGVGALGSHMRYAHANRKKAEA